LRFSTVNHLNDESAMRLARAAPPRSQLRGPETERDLGRLAWALPRMSDGAFKLYAFLCLRHDANVHSSISLTDVRVHLGKSKDEIDTLLAELESIDAVHVTRDGANASIAVVAQPVAPAPKPGPLTEAMPKSAA